MTLWLVLTVMIAVAAVLVSTPFIRRFERSRLETAGHLAVYRDQLNAIDSEAAQGLIDEAQAESARLEIKRKILAADRADDPAKRPLAPAERKFALTAVTAIVTFGSILLYAVVGSPELPSASPAQARMEQPLGPRLTLSTPPSTEPAARPALSTPSSTEPAARLALSTPPGTEPVAPQTTAKPQTSLPSVEEMTQRLQTKLQRNPQDVEGWRMLGWAYFNIEHFADAADAYSKAIELRPDAAEYRSARGEALVREAIGQTRSLARGLSPVTLESDGLASALQELAANSEKMFGIACSVECEGPVLLKAPATLTHLYRIAQEAVSNAVRHGKACQVRIRLESSPSRTVLCVTDNGGGFADSGPKPNGMGLRIMRYRAGMIGGALSIDQGPGGGLVITCSVLNPGAEPPASPEI